MQHNIEIAIDRGVELNALEAKAGMVLCKFLMAIHISVHIDHLKYEADKFGDGAKKLRKKTWRNYMKVRL